MEDFAPVVQTLGDRRRTGAIRCHLGPDQFRQAVNEEERGWRGSAACEVTDGIGYQNAIRRGRRIRFAFSQHQALDFESLEPETFLQGGLHGLDFQAVVADSEMKAALLAAVAHIGDNLSHGFAVGRAQREGQLRLR
jgi:hypothetical protein